MSDVVENNHGHPPKKQKTADNSKEYREESNEALDLTSQQLEEATIHLKPDIHLSSIKFVKVLNTAPASKAIFVEGLYNNEKAVVILEKTPFDEKSAKEMLERSEKALKRNFSNDIYGNYTMFPNPELNDIKTTIIHPATENHIEKYSSQEINLIEETAEDYAAITLPFIQSQQFTLDWVYNILNHTSESERVVFEDPDPKTGFILLPDLKWNNQTLDDLYLVAICNLRGIKCLRDLKTDHLPLLRNIREKGSEAICKKYGMRPSRLRIFVHYQPSYYHFHVHFTSLFDAPGSRVERGHLLSTIINNIELCEDYYQKARLTFSVRQQDKLLQLFKEAKRV